MQFRYVSIGGAFILRIISYTFGARARISPSRACRFAYILIDYRHDPG